MKERKNGFTLVEILGVIALLSIMALITVPAVTNVINKQKEKVYYDQLSQLIRASQNWGTNNKGLLESDLSGYCKSDGTWERYELSLSNLQNGTEDVTYLDSKFINPKTEKEFENTKVYVYKKEKSYLYCVDAPECYEEGRYPVNEEYRGTASNLCCNGEEFKQRLSECIMPDEDELVQPIATIDSTDWKQSKVATATFKGSGMSFINSSVSVTTNVTAVECSYINGAEYLCDGSTVVLANGTLLANTWYQINEKQVQLTYNTNGVLLTRTSNGLEYQDGNELNINKIDTTAPIIRSLSGTSVAESGYNTTSLQLTALAIDVESEIAIYEFYKVTQSTSKETLLGSNTTGIYKISNPTGGYNYKVKVYNNAGLFSDKTLTETCEISQTGACSNGKKTVIYTCSTGRKYYEEVSNGCTTTTTMTSTSCPHCSTSAFTCSGLDTACLENCSKECVHLVNPSPCQNSCLSSCTKTWEGNVTICVQCDGSAERSTNCLQNNNGSIISSGE